MRIRAKIQGTGTNPRLSVFRSNTHTYAQLIDDDAKKVMVSSSDMKSKKGTKTENAKKVGSDIAKLAKEKNISKVVFDRSGYKYHGRIKAVAEGAREGGLQF
jgi:large subunit ribosomal protein L18